MILHSCSWNYKSELLLESLLTYGGYTTAKIKGSFGDKLMVELTSVAEYGIADISRGLCEANAAHKVQTPLIAPIFQAKRGDDVITY